MCNYTARVLKRYSLPAQQQLPTLGGMFGQNQLPKRGERNFLRENKLQLRELNQEKGRTIASRFNAPQPLRVRSYEQPTAASMARRCQALPLVESQRRLMIGRQRWGGGQGTVRQRPRSEKQIQTEDICDEQFLSEALRKCVVNGHAIGRHVQSDGDDVGQISPPSGTMGLRRTSSSFELGRAPAQGDAYQLGQYTLQRPVRGAAGTLPGALDHEKYWQNVKGSNSADSIPVGAHKLPSAPKVMQMQVPEVIDVDQESQMDQPLSARSVASVRSKRSAQIQTEQITVEEQPPEPAQRGKQQQMQQDELIGNKPLLLTEAQRLVLTEEAKVRQRQLISQYNRLPLSMGTLRVRKLKQQLEMQLDLIDKDLSVLAMPKVYVNRQ